MYNTNLDEISLIVVLEFLLRENKCVKHLDLSRNHVGVRLADLLKKYIEKNNEIAILRLSGCGINTKMFCIISIGIAQNQSLEEINFSNNSIGTFKTIFQKIFSTYINYTFYFDKF